MDCILLVDKYTSMIFLKMDLAYSQFVIGAQLVGLIITNIRP